MNGSDPLRLSSTKLHEFYFFFGSFCGVGRARQCAAFRGTIRLISWPAGPIKLLLALFFSLVLGTPQKLIRLLYNHNQKASGTTNPKSRGLLGFVSSSSSNSQLSLSQRFWGLASAVVTPGTPYHQEFDKRHA
ncbi:hypothetical protein CRG98_028474 [Punica granatum]|uniref:Uncharacterized protein n=1 Tax=Punica granatum TaxID=22663 RepID=A0A2I0J4M5_PUNGR|nr:hypothetical protein CRG98_028474 [Punica granatum]